MDGFDQNGVTSTVHEASPDSAYTEFVVLPHLQIKDELEDNIAEGDINETQNPLGDSYFDPMNLLEARYDHNESANTSQTTEDSFKEKWFKWMRLYPWLLHEDADRDSGYCLYCGFKLFVKSNSHLTRHDASIAHKEKERTYLAFRESEDILTDSASEANVKDEFERSANVAALKRKRMSQTQRINDFNWSRWLEAHKWLVRDENNTTVGYCKVCKMRVNVEFSHLRERHETTKVHKRAEELFSQYGENAELPSVEKDKSDDELRNESSNTTMLTNPWYKKLPNNSCRCKLCNVNMFKHSFKKHLRSKIHAQRLRESKLVAKIGSDVTKPIIKKERDVVDTVQKLQKVHPWLIVDPSDRDYGYCKYCEKRFVYIFQMSKRQKHENGAMHKLAETEYFKKERSQRRRPQRIEQEVEEEEEEGEEEEDGEEEIEIGTNEIEEEPNDSNAENDNYELEEDPNSSKRLFRGTDAWFDMYPWCEKYPKDPGHYYCSYCDLLLVNNLSREKHASSARHRIKEYEIRRNSRKHKHRHNSKRARFYPWLAFAKGNPKVLICKYCRVRFSSSYSRKKHEKSLRHKQSEKEYFKRKKSLANSVAQSSSEKNVKSIKTEMDDKSGVWMTAFSWLTILESETRIGYAYCKYCEQTMYMPSSKYALRHENTNKHIREQKAVILKGSDGDFKGNRNLLEESAKNDAKQQMIILKERFPWLSKISEDRHYAFCKYCEIKLKISGGYKLKHEKTEKHRLAEEVFLKKLHRNSTSTSEMSCVEDNGDAYSDKSASEVNTEDLDCSTQESTLESQATENTTDKEYTEPPSKRAKRPSTSEVDRGARLPNAHAELLKLIRDISESKSYRKSLQEQMLAACLKPLVQSNLRHSLPVPGGTGERNTFDLFFESIRESVKKLPMDLALEGKFKMMEVVYELELKALRRESNNSGTNTNTSSCGSQHPTDIPSTTTLSNGTSTQQGKHNACSSVEKPITNGLTMPHLRAQLNSQDCLVERQKTPPKDSEDIVVIDTGDELEQSICGQTKPRNEVNIRCVPLKSLTETQNPAPVNKRPVNDPYIRQIQVDSRTQSRIIPVRDISFRAPEKDGLPSPRTQFPSPHSTAPVQQPHRIIGQTNKM